MADNVAKNTLHLTIASIGQKIIAFVYFLLVARVMMPELTGQYFLATSIVTIFSVFADFGITPVVIREVAKDRSRAKEMVSHALALKIPLIIISGIGAVLIGMALGYDPSVKYLIALACAVLFFDAVSLLFYGILRGFQVLRYESVGILCGQTFTAIFGGLSLLLHPTLDFLVLALICGSFLNVLISGALVVRLLGFNSIVPRFAMRDIFVLMRTAIPFALAAIFVRVYSYIDTVLLSKLYDSTAVGIYSVAYKFTYAFQFLPLAFVAALYPNMSALAGQNKAELGRVLQRSMWYMAILSTPIVFGLWLIADEAVALVGGEYSQAAGVLRVLVFVLIPIFLDFPVGSLLNAVHHQTTKTIILGVTMVINIIVNSLLIPILGSMGAAYAALISFIFMFVSGLYFARQILPTFSILRLARVLLPVFASALLMFVVGYFVKYFIAWFLLIPVCAVVYIVALAVSGSVRKSDIKLIKRLVFNKL